MRTSAIAMPTLALLNASTAASAATLTDITVPTAAGPRTTAAGSPSAYDRFRSEAPSRCSDSAWPASDCRGEAMYESADIIDYLYRTCGGRSAPTRLLRRPTYDRSWKAVSFPSFR
jgi:hypothetical protein